MFKHATGGWVMVALVAIVTLLRFTLGNHLTKWGVAPHAVDVVAVAFLYVTMVVLIRWQMIALPIHNQLNARLEAISLDIEPSPGSNGATSKSIHTLLTKARELTHRIDLLDILFWSRGQETAVWRLIDEAELLMVESWSEVRLQTRLPAMGESLKTLRPPSPEAIEVSTRIAKLFSADPPTPDAGSSRQLLLREHYLQGMLVRQTSLQNDDVELDYYNNKLMWYIVIALTAVILIANVLPHMHGKQGFPDLTYQYLSYLIAGAVGGVLSRMTRATLPLWSPNEFGSKWMALFLSPLVGALAGWAGIMILTVAAKLTVVTINAADMTGEIYFALAIVFGFSERLFTDLTNKVESQLLKPADPTPVKPS